MPSQHRQKSPCGRALRRVKVQQGSANRGHGEYRGIEGLKVKDTIQKCKINFIQTKIQNNLC